MLFGLLGQLSGWRWVGALVLRTEVSNVSIDTTRMQDSLRRSQKLRFMCIPPYFTRLGEVLFFLGS